jgi:hypothetical protein
MVTALKEQEQTPKTSVPCQLELLGRLKFIGENGAQESKTEANGLCRTSERLLLYLLAKSLGTVFNPVNKKCVHRAVCNEIERRLGA